MDHKLTVFEINSVPYGSTGRIMFQIAEKVKEQGGKVYTATSFTRNRNLVLPTNHYQISGAVEKMIHLQLARMTGKHGCYSRHATQKLISRIKKVNPDLIHLHNLHEGVVNIPVFFDFLKSYGKPIVWTLHDCWAFTGHCPHFTFEKCQKWKTGCYDCPKYNQYPSCRIDDSAFQYQLKKASFQGIPNMTLVTPSQWLADLVKQSFLKEYPVKVINNGINLEFFKPMQSNFRIRYRLTEKIIVLGVAFDWGPKKGLQVFKKLSEDLDDRFAIVMVGVRPEIKADLPERILAIECTQNQKELAEIYSAADLFVNPTLEENFPTVNLEALACGTPVLTYDTGGSSETIDGTCGWVVPYANYTELIKKINVMQIERPNMKAECLIKAQSYDLDAACTSYVNLYQHKIGNL